MSGRGDDPRPGADASPGGGDARAGGGAPGGDGARAGGGAPGGISAVIEARVRAGGLLRGPVVVLYSGGRDSTCLLDLAVRLAGPVTALHVNYGLRDAAGEDEAHCAAVCARLGVELVVHRPSRPEQGNIQAWARDRRYAEAARLALSRGALVAAGHTATDQVETVLYRLAASPGRRALLGMPERSGRLVRPLLGVTREETAAYCDERGLAWREDASNADSKRGRLRTGLVPALRELHPAAEENILRTLALLRDEATVLDAAADAALGDGPPEIARLAALPPALARLAIQRLADKAAGGEAPPLGAPAGADHAAGAGDAAGDGDAGGRGDAAGGGGDAAPSGEAAGGGDAGGDAARGGESARGGDAAAQAGEAAGGGPALADHVAAILALGGRGGTASLDLPGGLRAVVTYGRLAIERARPAAPPAATRLTIPGSTPYGGGELTARRGPDLPIADGTLDASRLAASLEVRPWRPGDRMRPLGLDGSRSLQDLFTDRKVARERRPAIPVVVSDGEIAWVPGLATSERFKVTDATTDRVRLAWREST